MSNDFNPKDLLLTDEERKAIRKYRVHLAEEHGGSPDIDLALVEAQLRKVADVLEAHNLDHSTDYVNVGDAVKVLREAAEA